jgi:hypothetical protein
VIGNPTENKAPCKLCITFVDLVFFDLVQIDTYYLNLLPEQGFAIITAVAACALQWSQPEDHVGED